MGVIYKMKEFENGNWRRNDLVRKTVILFSGSFYFLCGCCGENGWMRNWNGFFGVLLMVFGVFGVLGDENMQFAPQVVAWLLNVMLAALSILGIFIESLVLLYAFVYYEYLYLFLYTLKACASIVIAFAILSTHVSNINSIFLTLNKVIKHS